MYFSDDEIGERGREHTGISSENDNVAGLRGVDERQLQGRADE